MERTEKQPYDYVLVLMKNLNLLIILYISVLIAYSLYGYLHENSALDFVAGIYTPPTAPWKIPVVSVSLYCCCLLLLQIQTRHNAVLLVKIFLELAVGFAIDYVTGFSYTGIVLLILADTMRYFPKSKWQPVFIVMICMVYLLTDYNLLFVFHKTTSLERYLNYFQNDMRAFLLGSKNILNSLNMMIFITYIILHIQKQFNEKNKILSLNEKLNMTNEELRQANLLLKTYAKEVEKAAATRERNRLAREIHDTLGHSLTGIITGIEACTALIDAAPDATKMQLKVIADVARQGMTDVRRSVKALRPDALEKMHLADALAQMIDEIQTATNVKIQYQCSASLSCFSEDEEDIIYRIVQESITNSMRHGKATNIQITISRNYNMLNLSIQDNGVGCDKVEKGFGLHHMEERLALLNGSLSYNGEHGFTLNAGIPIRWGTEENEDD